MLVWSVECQPFSRRRGANLSRELSSGWRERRSSRSPACLPRDLADAELAANTACHAGGRAGQWIRPVVARGLTFPADFWMTELRSADRKSAGASGALEAPDLIGGPSRTRTLDPLIKSRFGTCSIGQHHTESAAITRLKRGGPGSILCVDLAFPTVLTQAGCPCWRSGVDGLAPNRPISQRFDAYGRTHRIQTRDLGIGKATFHRGVVPWPVASDRRQPTRMTFWRRTGTSPHRRARPRPRQGHRHRRLGPGLPRRHRPHHPVEGRSSCRPSCIRR
jgi:hypothetical protein